VLRIVAELHDVKLSIIALQQVTLATAAHLSDKPYGTNRHRQQIS
jgi:hypothetical protein